MDDRIIKNKTAQSIEYDKDEEPMSAKIFSISDVFSDI